MSILKLCQDILLQNIICLWFYRNFSKSFDSLLIPQPSSPIRIPTKIKNHLKSHCIGFFIFSRTHITFNRVIFLTFIISNATFTFGFIFIFII